MKFATEAIHSSYDCDEHNRAIMPPIYQNSMFAMHEIGEQIPYRYCAPCQPHTQSAGRHRGRARARRGRLCFCQRHGGHRCGVAHVLHPGDTIVAVADTYGGAYDLLTEVYAAWGINVVFADLTDPQSLDTVLASTKVKMLWLETPSNPLLRLVDIEALAAKAKAAGALVGIDNTFATPYLQNPLRYGLRYCVSFGHQISVRPFRCVDGHCGGERRKPASLLRGMMVNTGRRGGADGLRLGVARHQNLGRAHEAASGKRAQAGAPLGSASGGGKSVLPGLASHEHHALAQKQMRGFGGVVSVYLKNNSKAAANSVIKNMKLRENGRQLGRRGKPGEPQAFRNRTAACRPK